MTAWECPEKESLAVKIGSAFNQRFNADKIEILLGLRAVGWTSPESEGGSVLELQAHPSNTSVFISFLHLPNMSHSLGLHKILEESKNPRKPVIGSSLDLTMAINMLKWHRVLVDAPWGICSSYDCPNGL